MDKDKQLTKYKKGFFERIKEKILSIFKKPNLEKNAFQSNFENDAIDEEKTKDEFMTTYNKVKRREISTKSLDAGTLKKIMIMLCEEIDMKDNILEKKIQEAKMEIKNIEMLLKDERIKNS